MESSSPIAMALGIFGNSQSALARALGVTQPAVRKALHAKRVSAELAIKIEVATNGEISRHALRPDLWDAPAPTSELARAE